MRLALLFLGLVLVTTTERFEAAREAFARGDRPGALATLAELADQLEGEHERAIVSFARGVVLADEREESPVTEALEPFESALALAGPGALRRDAAYDIGWVRLDVAEALFVELTEPPPPAAPPAAGAATPEPPDPKEQIAAARMAYGVARDRFIERLTLDWRDEDTRANLEWIQRRLRELDEIERQIEEQEQEQEEQDSAEDSQDGEPQENDEDQEGEQEPQDGEPEPSDEKGEPQDGEQEQEPGEDSEQSNDEPSEEEGEEEAEPPEPSEEDTEESAGDTPEPPEGAPGEERFLTKEEVQRLLDKLQELDQEGEAVRAALQRARHIPVERDW